MHHVIEALILGLVQGLTEFLPISSSAHLRILGEFLPGAQDPGAAFTAITQLGTETAVVVFFWRDIVRIVSHWCEVAVRPGAAPRSRCPHGLAHHHRVDPDRRARHPLPGPDRDDASFAVDRRDDAHRVRPRARTRRLGRREEPQARPDSPCRTASTSASRSLSPSSPGSRARAERSRWGSSSATNALRRRATRSCSRSPPSSAADSSSCSRAWASPRCTARSRRPPRRSSPSSSRSLVIAFFMSYISKRSFLPFVIYRVALGGLIFVLLGTGVINA